LKIRFVKKFYAWLLTNISLLLFLLFILYFYLEKDAKLSLNQASEVKLSIIIVLSHVALLLYLFRFVQFLTKEKTIDLTIDSDKFSITNEKERYFKKIIVNRRRIDDRLADIRVFDQYGNVFEISSCYVSENGNDDLLAQLGSLGRTVEIQNQMF
jgi:hypothetical protein